MRIAILGAVCAASFAGAGLQPQASDPTSKAKVEDAKADDPTDPLGFMMTRIDGKPEALEHYRGKVVVMVNVASKCGLTPQYEGLEAIYKARKDDGLVILGFPANNFGAQEPGTDAQIKEFCESRFAVSFPMFSKISVKGDDQHPLYAKLTKLEKPLGGEIEWNFTKFVVDRSGHVVARFGPKVDPADPAFNAKLDELLKVEASSEGGTQVGS